jgi:hypothetical protein
MKRVIILSAVITVGISCKKESDEKPDDGLTNGLLAYYPFNGNANDESGNQLNGMVQNGAQLTTDRFGAANSAFYFDGINDNIIVTDQGQLSQPTFTVAFYFNTEKTTTQIAVGKINESTGNAATYNFGVYPEPVFNPYFGVMDENLGCDVQVPTNLVYTLFTNQPIITNRWYFMAATFENGKQYIYIDGVLVATANRPFAHAKYCTETDFLIGSWWANDKYSFQGKIDEVRYYNRALSQAEVQTLFKTP